MKNLYISFLISPLGSHFGDKNKDEFHISNEMVLLLVISRYLTTAASAFTVPPHAAGQALTSEEETIW
jgi:hypothetical protein